MYDAKHAKEKHSPIMAGAPIPLAPAIEMESMQLLA